jgi:cob(I)alamin adenosyltransferase
MYNRRVPKSHPRVEAYGCVDELNSALGWARATATNADTGSLLLRVQQDLVTVMGELATLAEDLPRYVRDGFPVVTPELTRKLDESVVELEAQGVGCAGWAVPGANAPAAALDLARAICRRAERRVCGLQQAQELPNAEILVYLNRLADLLWLLARRAESLSAAGLPPG